MWFGSDSTGKLEDQYQNIAFMMRILRKQSEKSQKEERAYAKKAKRAIEESDMRRAELYATQAIRHRDLSIKYLQTSMRMELVASMAQSAIATGQITDGIADIIRTTTSISDPMGVVSKIDSFERAFDSMSISSMAVDTTMDRTAGLLTPVQSSEVSSLLDTLNDEHALETLGTLPSTEALKKDASEINKRVNA